MTIAIICQKHKDGCPIKDRCNSVGYCLDKIPTAFMYDKINPQHYKSHPSGIECIQITRHMNFNRGNAMKYIWRAGDKNPVEEIIDIEKAIWYLKDEIKRLKSITSGQVQPLETTRSTNSPAGGRASKAEEGEA